MSARDVHVGPPFDLYSFVNRPSSGVTLERYERDQRIFVQGDPAETVGYIRKGAVKSTILSDHGKEAIVGIFRQGQFFGEASVGASRARATTVVALEDSLVTLITRERMLATLSTEPDFSAFFLTHLLSRNDRLEGDLVDQLFNSSEKRLARTLLLLARYGKEDKLQRVLPKVSQEMLAEMVGTTRSRVNFFMNKFRKLGFIKYNGGLQIDNSLLSVVLHE